MYEANKSPAMSYSIICCMATKSKMVLECDNVRSMGPLSILLYTIMLYAIWSLGQKWLKSVIEL